MLMLIHVVFPVIPIIIINCLWGFLLLKSVRSRTKTPVKSFPVFSHLTSLHYAVTNSPLQTSNQKNSNSPPGSLLLGGLPLSFLDILGSFEEASASALADDSSLHDSTTEASDDGIRGLVFAHKHLSIEGPFEPEEVGELQRRMANLKRGWRHGSRQGSGSVDGLKRQGRRGCHSLGPREEDTRNMPMELNAIAEFCTDSR